MNQTLNGKIKPLKVLKTTQFQGAPLHRPRSPSRAGTRRDFKPNRDFFGGPPHHISWLPASLKGSFTPPPAVSDVRLARKIPSVFNLDPHFHPPSLSPPRAPPLPASSAGVCARQASVTFFFFLLVFIFSSKNVCGLFCPPQPPFSQAHAPAQPSLPGPAKNLSVLSPATAAGSENSQMTEDFQP